MREIISGSLKWSREWATQSHTIRVGFNKNCGKKWGSLATVGRRKVHWELWEGARFTGNCGKKSSSTILTLWSGVRNATFWPNLEASPTHSNNIINRVNSWGCRGPDFGKSAQMNSNVTLRTSVGATQQDSEVAIATWVRNSSAGPLLPGLPTHNNQWSHIWKKLNLPSQNLPP